jgi:hypothetical protein
MVAAVRNLMVEAKSADTSGQCTPIIDKAIRRLDSLAKRVDPVSIGRKGGTKTAERGPEYFAKIAAMRKTRGGGRPKKQAASDQT